VVREPLLLFVHVRDFSWAIEVKSFETIKEVDAHFFAFLPG